MPPALFHRVTLTGFAAMVIRPCGRSGPLALPRHSAAPCGSERGEFLGGQTPACAEPIGKHATMTMGISRKVPCEGRRSAKSGAPCPLYANARRQASFRARPSLQLMVGDLGRQPHQPRHIAHEAVTAYLGPVIRFSTRPAELSRCRSGLGSAISAAELRGDGRQ